MRNVMVALRMAGEAGQGKLLGIYRYISEHEAWNLRILESTHELTPNVISDALRNGYDGFIVSMIAARHSPTPRKATASSVIPIQETSICRRS